MGPNMKSIVALLALSLSVVGQAANPAAGVTPVRMGCAVRATLFFPALSFLWRHTRECGARSPPRSAQLRS